ncbi:hypothetical protein HPB50_002177 [Hyalomma asiaticum]|uniref:Uncharacterized protein n=1 Tax=Hyalomma asiaticum TaxID=266040 RepID=A0ACB7RGX2_HYAAI|nr:hypothetical protein HPB50_002177 [Hyalomma asiaticum]
MKLISDWFHTNKLLLTPYCRFRLLPVAAEGHAISEALAHYTQPGSSPKAVHIFTESQQVIQTLQARSKIPAYYARRTLNYAAQLQQRSNRVRIHWIPGHTIIPGNGLVHQRALQHHSKEQLGNDSSKKTATPFQDDTHQANYTEQKCCAGES